MKTFASRALAPVTERKRLRAQLHIAIGYLIGAAIIAFASFYSIRRDTAKALADAPFTALGSMHEYVAAKDDQGVPTDVFINGEKWEIRQVDHFKDVDDYIRKNHLDPKKPAHIPDALFQAETFCDRRVIVYIPAEDPATIREIIMHEIFHAGACLHGNSAAWWGNAAGGDEAHVGVYHLGEFMASFALSNPEFMGWMSRYK